MASSKKDEFEKILSDNVDFRKRRIYFGGLVGDGVDTGSDFSWGTVESTIRALHALSDGSQKPIELHMSSGGGETYEMFRLYDAIQECPCQVKFVGSGQICSSAVYIMAGCDERYLAKNTLVMVHKGHGGVSGDDNEVDIQISAKQNRDCTDKMNQILADNSIMPKEYWDTVTGRDLNLTAEETIALGLADKIIEYKKRGNLRRSRIALLKKRVDEDNLSDLLLNINKRIHLIENMKVEISIPKERHDSHIIVDDTPIEELAEKENGSDEEAVVENKTEEKLD